VNKDIQSIEFNYFVTASTTVTDHQNDGGNIIKSPISSVKLNQF